MADNFLGYQCSICGETFDPEQDVYVCPFDGGNLDILLDIQAVQRRYAFDDITSRTDYSMWRYTPLISVHEPERAATPLQSVGWTPIYQPGQLKIKLGLKSLWVKDEGRNPTGSLKDRASAVVLARAMEIHSHTVVTASTGNAGAALAG